MVSSEKSSNDEIKKTIKLLAEGEQQLRHSKLILEEVKPETNEFIVEDAHRLLVRLWILRQHFLS